MSTLELVRVGLVRDDKAQDQKPITSPAEALEHLTEIAQSDREQFVSIHLDTRHNPLGMEVVSVGSLSASIVHPREVFKAAILNNASSMLLAHNHPSGDPTPSRDDIEITKRLIRAGELMGIDILDHLIVAPVTKWLSMRELGVI